VVSVGLSSTEQIQVQHMLGWWCFPRRSRVGWGDWVIGLQALCLLLMMFLMMILMMMSSSGGGCAVQTCIRTGYHGLRQRAGRVPDPSLASRHCRTAQGRWSQSLV